ncbi:MAG TPA: ATP-binding protein [Gaiellaceae bacterium]|nr:ATP-binding protein [Gaiellaceae bacterium]
MSEPSPNGSRPARRRLELRPRELRRRVDPERLRFSSTAEVEPLIGTVGQPRALDAIEFGLAVDRGGFNVFVAGEAGSGRLTTVLDTLEARAAGMPPPPDWVYVHNFAAPDRPRAISLPAGDGTRLARAMDSFVETVKRELPRAFESEEYERRERELAGEIGERRATLEHELDRFAEDRSFAVRQTPTGIVSMPLVDGKPLSREEFGRLPPERQAEIARATAEMEERVAGFVHRLRELEKETAERMQRLDREVALFATGPLFRELEDEFGGVPEVLAYLEQVKEDLLEHVPELRGAGDLPFPLAALAGQRPERVQFRVNVLVDNSALRGAPVVVERNPTYYNLVGRVQYRASFGAMVTDFREIKPGALQRANGGFLVLEALDVLRHPFAWDALERALRSREVRIENLGEELSALPSASLRPEPIPIDVKVVLLGSSQLYHLLYALDEGFRELFKVKAHFAPELDWSAAHERSYAAFVSRCVRDGGLLHFDRGAVARVIEHGGRLRESQRKLSARLQEVADLVSEASFRAREAGHPLVTGDDVALAVRKRDYRTNLLEERVRELIADGTIAIETSGRRVGQVNGLSIVDLGDHGFGLPARVSARVAVGRGQVASIEREIELSGPIHSKGVLILSGYLASTYGQERPLALSATLTFEQSYDEVEGDSASSTELYALLSALSGLPLDQGIAVTGSVDQNGNVQAVGGVTRKVEGFFATCRARGLDGSQGVVIPAANVPNLMLDDEVVDAVREGRFHVWAVRTVDEGISLLTGRPAGRRGADGRYPPGSVHRLVSERLEQYAERLRAFAATGPDGAGAAEPARRRSRA